MADDEVKLSKVFESPQKHSFTQEQIAEMRALGMPKPKEVSYGEWMGPKKISHTHEAMIYLAASGATNKKIAEELGYTQSRISIILSKPEIKEKIRIVQEELWGGNAEKRFNNLLPDAIDVLADVVRSKNDSTRDKISASKELLDRALGKAKQSVSVEGNLLGDLIARLDQQETRDVTNPALESGKDQAAEFVEEFLGDEQFTVGKRKEEEDG